VKQLEKNIIKIMKEVMDNINTIKTHANRRKVTLTRVVDGEIIKQIHKGVTLDNIPKEYNEWFTYKGLTFITR